MTGRLSKDDELLARIRQLVREASGRPVPVLVLVGGCSRAGKSWLCGHIAERFRGEGLPVVTMGLDAWLVGADQRKPGSKVMERYDVERIARDIDELMQGREICPPVYDAKTRLRVSEAAEKPVSASGGIVLVDGVIALAVAPLRKRAALRIYVETTDAIRRRRLHAFYGEFKQMPADEMDRMLAEREAEEVPFVRSTRRWADTVITADDEAS